MPNKKKLHGIDMQQNKVTNLPTPTDASDAATKQYVDNNAAPTVTANRAVVSDANGKVAASTVTSTELARLSGVTSNVQTQLNNKTDVGHTQAATTVNFTAPTGFPTSPHGSPTNTQLAIENLFQSANSGKNAIAGAIGGIAVPTSETFGQLATRITNGKSEIATAINDGAVTSSSTFTELRDAILDRTIILGTTKNVFADETILKNDVIESYYRGHSPTFLNLGLTSTGLRGGGVSYSSDGYFAFATHGNTPASSLRVYSVSGDTYTPITVPATANAQDVKFSPNNEFLACALDGGNNIAVYRKATSTELNATNVTYPGTTITSLGNAYGVAWSPDSQFLTLAHLPSSTYPTGFSVFQRNSSAFTRLSISNVNVDGFSTAWHPNGNILAVGYNGATHLQLWTRSGTTFTNNTATLIDGQPSASSTQCNNISFSPDGTYMVVNITASPFFVVYKWNGTSYVRGLVTIDTPPTSGAPRVGGSAWTSDGQYLIVNHQNTGANTDTFSIYRRRGDAFTKQTRPSTVPAGAGYKVAVSPDNRYYAMTVGSSAPYLYLYRNDGQQLFVKVTDFNANISTLDRAFGVARQNGTQGQLISAGIIIGGANV